MRMQIIYAKTSCCRQGLSVYHFNTYLHAKTQELEFISAIWGLDLDQELSD